MNEEQLLSYINHQLSQVAHLTALRDVVAIVVEAKQRVEEFEKKAKAADAAVENLKVSAQAIEADLAAKQRAHTKSIEDEKREAEKRYDAYIEVRKAEAEQLATNITALHEQEAQLQAEVEQTRTIISRLRVAKADYEADVEAVQKQLRDIKESIR